MNIQQKAKAVIDKLLGEATAKFTPEFKDLLALIRGLRECANLSFDWQGDSEDEENDPGVQKAGNLFFSYGNKYGGDIIHTGESHMDSGRMVTDDYWSDITSDVTYEAVEALKSGSLKPFSNVGPKGTALAIKAINQALGYDRYDPRTGELSGD